MKKLFIVILSILLLVIASTSWASHPNVTAASNQISASDSDRAPRVAPYRVVSPAPFSLDDLIWLVGSTMPTARYSGVTGTYDGEIFVSHGRILNAAPYNTNVVEAYNPSAYTWRTNLTPGPTARRMVAGGAMYEGSNLYVVGGREDAYNTVGTLEIYDMSTDTWTTGLPCSPRWAHAGAVLDGYVYVFGSSGSPTPNTSAERYNISTGTWESIANMPNGTGWLCGAAAAGKVYAIGGLGTESVMQEYDPTTDTWTLRAPLPNRRIYARAVTMNNRIYVCGGDYAPTSVDVYNPATDTWTAENDMPGTMCWMQLGQDAGSIYVIGGTPQSWAVVYQNQCWQGTFGVAGQPAAVSDFEAIAGAAGAVSCSLSWVNPTLDALGDPLVELIGVRILRDGVQIANLTPTGIGAAMEYWDNTIPMEGQYSYTVYGYNSGGDGLRVNVTLWVGADIPCSVNDLLMTPGPSIQMEATLTWINPTSGVHGGFYPGVTGYTIVRNSDEGYNATFNLPGTHTSFLDETIPFPDYYWYEVTPYNTSGDGLSATSDTAWVGPSESWTWEEITYNWFDISSIGTSIVFNDDDNQGPFPLGFTFTFWGLDFSTIRACSNGWLSFTSISTSLSNTFIPNAGSPNDLIAMFWDDLDPPEGSSACYYYQDTTDGRWIIQYTNVEHYPSGNPETFQCIIDEDGFIEVHYQQVSNNASCTIGIEDDTGSEGIEVCYDGSGEFIPTNNSAIRFFPPLSLTVGTLEGYVYEEEVPQNPIEGAYVVIRSDTGYTDANGFYHVENIYAGINTAVAHVFGYNYATETLVIAHDSTTIQDFYLTQPLIDLNFTSIDLVLPANYPHDEEFYIYNNGNGPLDYDITIVGTGTNWLSVVPEQGSVAAGDSQLVTASFLMPDTANVGDCYQADLTIDNNSNTPQIIIPVEVTIIINAVIEEDAILPREFALYQNYPNPFNPVTMISYDVPVQGMVQLEVFDVLGRKVATLVNGEVSAGRYHVTWNAGDMPSGVYFCRMQAESYHQVRKVVLLK